MGLETYRNKRDFNVTNEPQGVDADKPGRQRFVVQEHHATRLHFDLRIEMGGTLKSWAVPKGPSLNPADRRLAVQTEDHPLEYLTFAGHIPDGNYGGGDMAVWDAGAYEIFEGVDPVEEWRKGRLKIRLFGDKLKGKFALIRLAKSENEWLLIKDRDEYEDRDWKLTPIFAWGSNKSKPADSSQDRSPIDVAAIDGARRAEMPDSVDPMLATLVDEPFSNDDWLFELKWDGFRGICFVENGRARMTSRKSTDLGARYTALATLPGKLHASTAILDGELVALDDQGRARFELLQTSLQTSHPVVYYAFDILHLDGFDLTGCRLVDRKRLLQQVLNVDNSLRYSDHVAGNGNALYEKAREAGVEGLMAKRANSHYEGRRSPDWLKIKILQRADVVIGGYTEPRGSRSHIGSLLAGAYVDGKLIPVGHVSIGSSDEKIKALYDKLRPLAIDRCPFDGDPRVNDKPHWVQPEIVAEVKFGEWTRDRQMRSAVLLGLRLDKSPEECMLETAIHSADAVEQAESDSGPPFPGGERVGVDSSLAPSPFQGEGRGEVPKDSLPFREGLGVGPDSLPLARGGAGLGSSSDSPSPNRGGGEGEGAPKPKRKAGTVDAEPAEAFADKSIGPDVALTVDGHRVTVSNLDKVYWPADGYTKRDLLRYYFEIAPTMLPHIRNRPLILRRYVDGIDSKGFFQHDIHNPPDFVQIFPHQEEDKTIHYAVCNNAAAMLYLANLGAISFDPWLCRIETPAPLSLEGRGAGGEGSPSPLQGEGRGGARALSPDVVVFDLDPGDNTMADVCRVAVAIRDELERLGMRSYAKTSGASGIHVYLPIKPLYDFDVVFAFAGLVARRVVDLMPDLATIERRIGKRGANRIYVDCVQNSEGKSVAAPYAVRARQGATVSAPVSWEEMERTVRIEDYSIKNMVNRVKQLGDLFAPVSTPDQQLSTALDIIHHAVTKGVS